MSLRHEAESGPPRLGRGFESQVPSTEPPERVDVFLAKHFRYFSRQKWQQVIRAGYVRRDGKQLSPSTDIRPGDWLLYTPPAKQEPEVNREFEVLFEDEHVLAINKPAPCPTTQCGGYLFNTVEFLVGEYLQGEKGRDFWMLHRLDMETSGVLLIAKSLPARRDLYEQFERHEILKSYVCVCKSGHAPCTAARALPGHAMPDNFFQELPVGDLEESQIRIKAGVRFTPPCKSALTFFTLLARTSAYSLIRCRLYTGRTNQIRIHLWAAGQWIVGDKMYYADESLFDRYSKNANTPDDWQKLETRRLLLHAQRVRLTHPLTRQPMLIQAPVPKDMKLFMQEKFAGLLGKDCAL